MTCADLNNFLTGVREKSWFAGGGVGGGRGGDAYYLFFFYYVKLMNSNYPEVGVPTPLQSHLSIRACKLLNRVYVSYKE